MSKQMNAFTMFAVFFIQVGLRGFVYMTLRVQGLMCLFEE